MANYGEEVVSVVLEELGIDIITSGGGWGNALCPLHEDSKPSFAIHLQEGGWICRAGCGQSSDLADLVQQLEGGSLRTIRTRLRNMFIDDVGLIARALNPPEKEEEERDKETLFYERGKLYKYILNRGFDAKFLKSWDVGVDTDLKAVVVPITEDHKLVGLFRRSIKGKHFFLSGGLDKDHTLFGLDHIPDDADTVIVVEAPLDALWLHQNGFYAVATLGSGLSYIQAQRLIKRFRIVYLAFDNDKYGNIFNSEGVRLLQRKVALYKATYPAGKKDPLECSPEELKLAFSLCMVV